MTELLIVGIGYLFAPATRPGKSHVPCDVTTPNKVTTQTTLQFWTSTQGQYSTSEVERISRYFGGFAHQNCKIYLRKGKMNPYFKLLQ